MQFLRPANTTKLCKIETDSNPNVKMAFSVASLIYPHLIINKLSIKQFLLRQTAMLLTFIIYQELDVFVCLYLCGWFLLFAMIRLYDNLNARFIS